MATPRKVEVVKETWFHTKERDVLTVGMSAVCVFSDVTLYVLVLRGSGERYCIQLYGRRKGVTSKRRYPSASRHIPEYSNLNIHRCVNPISYIVFRRKFLLIVLQVELKQLKLSAIFTCCRGLRIEV